MIRTRHESWPSVAAKVHVSKENWKEGVTISGTDRICTFYIRKWHKEPWNGYVTSFLPVCFLLNYACLAQIILSLKFVQKSVSPSFLFSFVAAKVRVRDI